MRFPWRTAHFRAREQQGERPKALDIPPRGVLSVPDTGAQLIAVFILENKSQLGIHVLRYHFIEIVSLLIILRSFLYGFEQ